MMPDVHIFQSRVLMPPEDGWPDPGDSRDRFDGLKLVEEAIFVGDTGWCWAEGLDEENGMCDTLTAQELLDRELVSESWRSECAFMSHEDASLYADRHKHDFRDGWRVYTVPAEGRLAELLETGRHDEDRRSVTRSEEHNAFMLQGRILGESLDRISKHRDASIEARSKEEIESA